MTTNSNHSADDKILIGKINEAVAAYNKTEETVKTAQAERASRGKVVGMLLLEAKKQYPKTDDFIAFLKRTNGVSYSWACDLMKLAGGRITEAELRKDAAERKRKSRAKRKLPSPPPSLPKPEPKSKDALPPHSVTEPRVTESQEISTEQRRADMEALDLSAEERAAKASADALAQFDYACRHWLPKITVESDRVKARLLVSEFTNVKPKAKAA
jgi:hypothetical protein